MPRTLRISQASGQGASGSLILGLAVVAGLVALASAFVVFALWPRWPGAATEPDAPTLPITVGGQVFNVPPVAIRLPLQRHAGAHERIDLAFMWPNLGPPDPTSKPVPGEESKTLDRLFLTIAAPNSALVPVDLANEIYPHYFANGPFAGPEGLMVRPFRDSTPYQGEDLFFDPVAPDPFIARCSRPGTAGTPGTCLYERRIANAIDVTVRFPREWLPQWKALAAGIDRLLGSLRAKGG
jgi:hypothetical protein